MPTERQLIERMRESGRQYLRKHPGAFGGGIEPSTGIRRVDGRRVSVTTPEEELAGIEPIRKPTTITPITKPTAPARRAISRRAIQGIRAPSGVGRKGTFTRAIDVGGGKMQDVLFSYSGGRITEKKLLGKPLPQSGRFKEKQRALLQQTIVPLPSIKQVKKGRKEFLDIVSGGYFTERAIDKKQKIVNQDVESFNKKFGGRELSQSEFREANKISKALETREAQITKDRDNLAKSFRSRAGTILWGFETGRMTSKELSERIEANKPEVRRQESKLEKTQKKIAKLSKEKGIVAKLNLKRLKNVRAGTKEEIQRLKTGTPSKVYTGEFPIIPAVSIPSGVTTIKFIGAQKKGRGGKIITDIVFQTSKGQIGVAKGVSVAKGKEGASVVLGRTGKRVFKFPSAKQKMIRLQTFIGREKTLTLPAKVNIQKNIQLLQGARKKGTVVSIKKNIDILKQAGIGQVGTVKGRKLMKGIKAVKGITVDNFASISAILTKKRLSLIIGKSITEIGAKSRFIGIIKGTSKAGVKVLTATQKKQYAKALQKVISVTAGALTKTKKTGKFSKATVLALASGLAGEKAEAKPRITPKLEPKVKAVPTPRVITKPKVKAVPTPRVITERKRKERIAPVKLVTPKKPTKAKKVAKVKVKRRGLAKAKTVRVSPAGRQMIQQQIKTRARLESRQKLLQKQLSKQRQQVKQLSGAKQRLAQKQVSALVKEQKLIVKQIIKAKAPPTIPRVPRLVTPPKFKRKKRKVVGAKPSKKKQAYNVHARPLKKKGQKKIPKLIKVNKVPLNKRKAKSVRNYIVDTSLSRTARIKKTKGKPKPSRLNVPSGYSKKTSIKFRNYRIVKGKRKPLPKGTVIEKRNRLLDTRGEKRGITARRRIAQITKPRKTIRKPVRTRGTKTSPTTRKAIRKPVRASPTRKQTPIQRTTMLKNLEKARRVRASNLKKKR